MKRTVKYLRKLHSLHGDSVIILLTRFLVQNWCMPQKRKACLGNWTIPVQKLSWYTNFWKRYASLNSSEWVLGDNLCRDSPFLNTRTCKPTQLEYLYRAIDRHETFIETIERFHSIPLVFRKKSNMHGNVFHTLVDPKWSMIDIFDPLL